MSASPFARQACSQAQSIPSKRVLITDASQMPDVYSSTPGTFRNKSGVPHQGINKIKKSKTLQITIILFI
jgi:hypothetical protein